MKSGNSMKSSLPGTQLIKDLYDLLGLSGNLVNVVATLWWTVWSYQLIGQISLNLLLGKIVTD